MVDNMFSLIFNSSSSSSMKILDEGIYVHDSYYNNETIPYIGQKFCTLGRCWNLL